MKKIVCAFFIIFCIILFYIIINKDIFGQDNGIMFMTIVSDSENQCFDKSYSQISDSMVMVWDSTFTELGIETNPFATLIFFIKLFSEQEYENAEGNFSLMEIFSSKRSNLKSNTIATCAIMQKLGWDIQCFYNKEECYLGVNFTENYKIRKAHWVEQNEKSYYLKEFDVCTPVGELKLDNPASAYKSLSSKKTDLKPIPLIENLPKFNGVSYEKRLKWHYLNKEYVITVSIPKEQIEWTKNLPPSLYGMAFSGIEELKNIGLLGKLKLLVDEFEEYDKVNFLFKFCQSGSIFIYDKKQPIKSISQQLMEGRNDCDGRSVFLYCLLCTVLEYSDSDIIFISWPNHLALGLKPRTIEAADKLKSGGFYAGNRYYVLDVAYTGDTYWGSKMGRLPDEYEIIEK